jgi:hypothetical protein
MYVAQTGLKLVILLLEPLKYWGYSCILPCLVFFKHSYIAEMYVLSLQETWMATRADQYAPCVSAVHRMLNKYLGEAGCGGVHL